MRRILAVLVVVHDVVHLLTLLRSFGLAWPGMAWRAGRQAGRKALIDTPHTPF